MSSWFARGPPKPTPGFHAIDIDSLPSPPARSSAPGAPAGAEATIGKPEEVMAAIRIQTGLRMHQARRTAQGLREARVQTTAVTFLQSYMRGAATRSAMPRLQKQALEEKARRYTAAQMIQEQHRRKHPPAPGSGAAAGGAFDDTPLPAADAFVIRNLDTGEAVSLELGAEEGAQDKDLKLSFGTLQQNPQAWEALKSDSKGAPNAFVPPPTSPWAPHEANPARRDADGLWRSFAGLLEKLASSTTISFRSYQLCVWQERYVYASDEALCYQHLSADMQPTGAVKTIPYSSIEFVGARLRPNPAWTARAGRPRRVRPCMGGDGGAAGCRGCAER
jgi:hypothetical protein